MTHDDLAMIEYGSHPALLILADGEAAEARARRSAQDAGCRVADVVSIDEALPRLERQVHADAVLLEIERDHGSTLDRLLDRLEWSSRSGQGRSVVAAPSGLIDVVAARVWHEGVIHLSDAPEQQRTEAIAEACTPREARLHDLKDQPGRLQQLSQEVGRIADILANLSADDPEPAGGQGAKVTAAAVRTVIRARRLRDRYFPGELFADPAFDMLLDLMAARLDNQRVAVSSLCIAAAVPATTALRWIKALTDQGVFVRVADPHDGRRVFIELSDAAAERFGAYLQAVQRLSPLMV